MPDKVLSLQIADFVKKVKANADIVTAKVTLDVGKALVEASPVDTGRFRANWTYAEGAFSRETYDSVDPSGTDTIETIAAGIDTQGSAGKTHFLTNSLPYAIRLEYGYSKQAPSGMAAITVMRFQEFIDNAVRTL